VEGDHTTSGPAAAPTARNVIGANDPNATPPAADPSATQPADPQPNPQADPTAPPEAAAADHPAAAPDDAPAAPATFGGSTPSAQVQAAVDQSNDPGFVVAKPLLTTGAYGHDVAQLAAMLEAAGHPNAVAAGLAPPMLSDELMRTVREFQEAQGIDPAGPQHGVDGPDANAPTGAPLVRRDHEGIVEWRTWAALYDAAGVESDVLEVDAIRYPAGSFA
jgi:hypothetical protein